jgi:hypothetical protein
MLHVDRMLIFTADRGRKTIESLYPPLSTPPSEGSAEVAQSPRVQTLVHHGRPSILQEVWTLPL